jgi:hypothetical protein
MPCETCESDPCSCDEDAVPSNLQILNVDSPKLSQDTHHEQHRQRQQPQPATGSRIWSSSPGASHVGGRVQRQQKQQPRLSIDTDNLQRSFSSGESITSMGGRFSPESFKQRVLRGQQLMAV